jgi:hypothetical protein
MVLKGGIIMNQNQNNIARIKHRTKGIHSLTRIVFIGGIVLLFTILIVAVLLLFASPENFSTVKGNRHWYIYYKVSDTYSSFVGIPFKIIQPMGSNKFSAKSALITFLISTALFAVPIILYGIKQITEILYSIAYTKTPFIFDNVNRLNRLAYSVIISSIVPGILISISCWIFVTNVFLINFSSISIKGIITGGLILVIADIFKYGIYLQDEFDSTL